MNTDSSDNDEILLLPIFVCDLYQRSNLLISDFRVCDSIDLDSLHKIYCMHMYGSKLWNLNCSYVDDFKVAWRKVKRRIWKLPCNTHNAIVKNLTYNIDDQLDVRIAKFTHMCLNHQNDVCRSISLSKYCVKTQHLLQTTDIYHVNIVYLTMIGI